MIKAVFLILGLFLVIANAAEEDNCKTVGSCALWAANRTGFKYNLDKFEKRSLKMEKDYNFKEGNADFIFNYLLQSNDLIRLKRESNIYQVIAMKDLKDFQAPFVKPEEIPGTMDFYSTEFSLSNKEQVKNVLIMIKKFLSKNGKALEVVDAPKIHVMDMGIHLNTVKTIIAELGK